MDGRTHQVPLHVKKPCVSRVLQTPCMYDHIIYTSMDAHLRTIQCIALSNLYNNYWCANKKLKKIQLDVEVSPPANAS